MRRECIEVFFGEGSFLDKDPFINAHVVKMGHFMDLLFPCSQCIQKERKNKERTLWSSSMLYDGDGEPMVNAQHGRHHHPRAACVVHPRH